MVNHIACWRSFRLGDPMPDRFDSFRKSRVGRPGTAWVQAHGGVVLMDRRGTYSVGLQKFRRHVLVPAHDVSRAVRRNAAVPTQQKAFSTAPRVLAMPKSPDLRES